MAAAALLRPTEKIYQRDPFLFASVASVLESRIEKGATVLSLDSTICFPEGGGQPSDTGSITIAGIVHNLLSVRMVKETNVVEHVVAGENVVEGGAKVELTVDSRRRFDHMQQHSSQHLLSALASSKLGLATAGWGLAASGPSYIDFDVKKMTDDQVSQLEDLANSAIRAGLPVTSQFLDAKDLANLPDEVRSRGVPSTLDIVRLVTIEGIDTNTCCGTHVTATGQLQAIKLTGLGVNCGKARMFFVAGNRLLLAADGWIKREKALTSLLSAGPEEHEAALERTQVEGREARRTANKAMDELAVFVAESLINDPSPIVSLHREFEGGNFIPIVLQTLTDRAPQKLVLITIGGESGPGLFVLGGPEDLLKKHGAAVAELLGGRGGGKGRKYQGKAKTLEMRGEALRACMAESSGTV